MSTALARELIMSYGWNATSCQILNPGIERWFSSTMQAVVGYTRRDSLLSIAGALGLVALAHAADKEMQRNPLWLWRLMQFARAHANRFYNFRGLEQFRVKMVPSKWEPL